MIMRSRTMQAAVTAGSLVAAVSLSASSPIQNPDTVVKIHVEKLAAPAMGGRLTGSEGERMAAEYIVEELTRLGARPLPGRDDFRLPFEFTAGVGDAGTSLTIDSETFGGNSVRALSFSDSGSVTAEVVFAGYGITVPESQDFGYDSYFGLDVEDKIVLVLRYFPEDASQEVRSILSRYSGLRYKALNARERGAKGLLVVSGPNSPNAGELAPLTFDSAVAGSGIVAASIRGEVAEKIFQRVDGKDLAAAQKELDSANPHVTGYAIPGLELRLETKLRRETRTAYNLAGYLPPSSASTSGGSDGSEGSDGIVLFGAHYDHLGTGDGGNSLAGKEEAGQIHFGADDNASGVAAVLAAAEMLAERNRRRPVAVAFWSGEELGLLGSAHFIKNEVLPAGELVAYVNFDMVGRMRDNRLVLQAVGTSGIWPGLVERVNIPVGFDIQMTEDPYLPTDVTSFNQAKVPSINFFTGGHSEYHRPSDRADTINYEDLARVARFGAMLGERLANLEERPEFVQVARSREEGGGRDSLRAFTGTIPDYATEVEGLLLSGVIEGGPAEKAGLQAGDVIVEFGAQKITNIYDYTYALDAVKIGEPLKVVFQRDGETKETVLTPTARK